MKYIFFSLLFILQIKGFLAYQFTVNVTAIPAYTNLADNVFLAGSFNGWDPANSNFLMTNNANGTYSIILEVSGLIEFKFTKGSFLMVEKDANCQEIANRTYTVNSNQTVNLQIANWRDYCDGEGQHTATSNVSILSENFSIPQLGKTRRVWLYLPPDYNNSTKTYPVIYMHDAQNLFDAYYSFSGEWEVDESLNLLFNQGDYGAIVVGIDNGGASRIDEYSPWINPSYGGGDGDLYMQFIVNTLKPYIDQNYRTKSNRENTAMIGSSMGGLISFYGGIEFQSVFSKLGIFSPSFWFSNQVYTHVTENPATENMRIYFVAGSQESTSMVPNINQMTTTLTNAQFDAEEIRTVIKTDGQHSEWFWRREFPAAYQWLFQDNTAGEKKNEFNENFIFQQDYEKISIKSLSEEMEELKLLDLTGKIMLQKNDLTELDLFYKDFSSGIYFIAIKLVGGQSYFKKIKL
jgi:predicted alpha/beta superfamily hydrolase